MEPRPLRALIVEDSEDDAELLLLELRRASYRVEHLRVESKAAMTRALQEHAWDIIVSDYNLPQFSALAALSGMHDMRLDLPFIIVSGAIGEETAVAAMKAGAHDYVMKGHLARLVPVIEREMRDAGERTARRHAEQALTTSEERYRTIVDTANDCIVALDEHGRTTYLNSRAPEMLGFELADLLGLSFLVLIKESDRQEWLRHFDRLRQGDRMQFDIVLRCQDGTELCAVNSASPVFSSDGAFSGAICMLKDVTERKRIEEALVHQALHDGLTGLPNRSLMHDRLEQAILTAARDSRRVSLLLIDLDNFKEVNDVFGHHYGDLLLQQVGPRLRSGLRQSDTVARLGGDEFAVILPNCRGPEDGRRAAKKILKALEYPFVIEGQTVHVAGSVGVVLYPDDGQDAQTLMRRADIAMYTAKRDGEGYSIYSRGLDQQSASRLALTSQLREGIDNNELVAFYQPKMSLGTHELIGLEALVRWQHPELGLVMPDRFIPLAEQTGLIKPLSQWMLSRVLEQCCEWQKRGLNVGVAVNLSMRNLHDPQLPDIIAELLQRWGIEPGYLQVEITETVLMTNAARAMDVITRLSAMGIHLSVDDFGTGYSSLAYLKRMPVHEIKIDKSFVHDMATNENDAVIVRSTIDLGHNLGLKVVAEGVETEAAWDQLVSLGCDLAQGYYMARPMSAASFETWLEESAWARQAPVMHIGQLRNTNGRSRLTAAPAVVEMGASRTPRPKMAT